MLVLAAAPGPVGAASPETGPAEAERPATVIVALPQMSWSRARAADMPHVHALMASSAVALMPAASPADPDPSRIWVTLGAGRAAVSGGEGSAGIAARASEVDTALIAAANQRARTSARPGLLGTLLARSGVSTSVIAFGEYPTGLLPASLAMLMDEAGMVDRGAVGAPAEMTPLGRRLDRQAVGAVLAEAVAPNRVSLLDLTGVGPLEHVDELVGDAAVLADRIGGRLLLLCAFTPAHEERDRRDLGFVVMRGFPQAAPGLLTSASTRWLGMVSPADIAPTVLAGYGAPPLEAAESGMAGRPMRVVPEAGALATLDRLDLALSERLVIEGRAARLYGGYLAALAFAALAAWRWRGEREGAAPALRWLSGPGLAAAAFPLGLLVAPLGGPGGFRQLAAAIAVAAGAGLWGARARRPVAAVAFLMLAGAALICADAVTGWRLMRSSPLGFTVMSGSRFYGIGNEFLGVLGGMVTIGAGAMLSSGGRAGGAGPKAAAVAAGVAAAAVVGAPWWGANWGGYIAVAAGLLAVWALGGREKRLRRAAAAVGLLAASALAPAAADLLGPAAERSHIGLTAAALLSGQVGMTADTALRKMALNWHIARQASWWWALAPVPFAAGWVVCRRARTAWRTWGEVRPLQAGFWGAVVTAVVAMVVNDSGVVALGMALAVAFGALVFLAGRAEEAA